MRLFSSISWMLIFHIYLKTKWLIFINHYSRKQLPPKTNFFKQKRMWQIQQPSCHLFKNAVNFVDSASRLDGIRLRYL